MLFFTGKLDVMEGRWCLERKGRQRVEERARPARVKLTVLWGKKLLSTSQCDKQADRADLVVSRSVVLDDKEL